MMIQVACRMPPTREMKVELLASGLTLAQTHLLQAFMAMNEQVEDLSSSSLEFLKK